MLVEFRVGNYRSFSEIQALSLVASKDTELEKNCIDQGKLRLLRAAGIYGPNASGKSNLIRALSTMQHIIKVQYNPGNKLPVTPFKLDEKYNKEPSFFEVTFYHGEVRYQYGFTATTERICDEWLYAYPKGRSRDIAQTWFERKFNRKTGKTNWDWKSKKLKGERDKLKDKTRDNVLFLTVGAIWNNKQLTTVYEWFSEKLRIIRPSEQTQAITFEMLTGVKKDEEWKEISYAYINEMMRRADFGIHGINIREEDNGLKEFEFPKEIKFPPDMPEEISNKILKNLAIRVEFIHRAEPTGKDIHFSPPEESDGTIRFFELAGPWLLAILEGMTLLVDELEASLHPLLVRELIEVIQNPDINASRAQLVFATHDTTLLDPELFRRDQIWFTEKNEEGATQLYSMSDYKERKPRKGEAMQKGYLAGRYGAIPILEAFDISNG